MRFAAPVGMPVRVAGRRGWIGLGALLALGGCDADGPDPVPPAPAVVSEIEGGGADLTLTVDRDKLTIVETVALGIEVESSETDTVEFPDSTDGFGQFAAVLDESVGDRLLEDGRIVRRREYILQPFLPGDYEIPSLTVIVNQTTELSTSPISVRVESVLEDPQDADLRDISAPVDIPVPRWWWGTATMALAALLAALAWWRRRRIAARSIPRVVPPHESALAALAALLEAGLPGPEGIEDFFLRLSDIVRRYVEDRFGVRAPEQTTEEFLTAMADESAVAAEHQRLLRSFLEEADLVKFARLVPGREAVEGAVEAARNFVRQTVPDELIAPEDQRE